MDDGGFGVIYDLLDECDGKIVDKDLAIFLCDYMVNTPPFIGGYPISQVFTFEEDGKTYNILAFGWSNEDNDSLYMIGFKEN